MGIVIIILLAAVVIWGVRKLRQYNVDDEKPLGQQYQEIDGWNRELPDYRRPVPQKITNRVQENTQRTEHTNTAMKKKITSFVAVDFETMTAEPTSICAAGLVRVVDGVIREQYYSLVKPVPDNKAVTNTFVHGITREMCENSNEFPIIHQLIRAMLDDCKILVCHNSNADLRYIHACEKHYNLTPITSTCIDTYQLSDKNLEEACKEYGIPLNDHHDALCDAKACARLFLELQGVASTPSKPSKPDMFTHKHICHDTLSVPTEEEIVDKSTVFYRSNCVITGGFAEFPTREPLAKLLRDLGADINTTISGKTTIVVMGKGAGPKKMEKIAELRAKGQQIRIIEEDELYDILDDSDIDW